MKTVTAGNVEVELHPSKMKWGTGLVQSKSVHFVEIEQIRYAPNVATVFTKQGEQHHFSFSNPEELEQFRWETARTAIASLNA
jgi:hypothetical protein